MRLGVFSQRAVNSLKQQKVIWLHTVSVGEAQACRILVEDLKRTYPDFRLVISTVTETGNKIAQTLIGPQDLVIYSPLDISFIVRRVINKISARLFIIAETEIWPNLIVELKKRGTPVVLVSGRISPGSFRAYKVIRPFLKEVFQNFSLFCMQTKDDAQKIITLGASEDKVKVTGNMKFDSQPALAERSGPGRPDLGLSDEEKLFIAGSTHRGEEKIILQVYRELIGDYPKLRLLIAPRHIKRVAEIEKLISGFGFKSRRISELNSDDIRYTIYDILILDSIGQLNSLYSYADIVFIGGSLIRHGGQNPIEPAVFSKPILFGPYMSNFSSIAKVFLDRSVAIMIKDSRELKKACVRLLDEPEAGRQLGEKAQELVRENRGATLRNMQLLGQLLES